MEPTHYNELWDIDLLSLCVWREASNQGWQGWLGVAHVIKNRILRPGWWGTDWRTVILKPYQFSSFNADDPNSNRWPDDKETAWQGVQKTCEEVYAGESLDPTSGATYYWSYPLKEMPIKWGPMVETFRSGALHFCKPAPKPAEEIKTA